MPARSASSTTGHPTGPTPPQESLYLAIDVIILSKHQEPPDEGSHERVYLVGLALRVGLQGLETLIGEHKAG